MSLHRGIDGSDPVRPQPLGERAGLHEERRTANPWRLGSGTLACPRCDAPIGLGGRAVTPAHALHCPFCSHAGTLRDFLSLAAPTRPARVEVRVFPRAPRTVP